MKGNRQVIAMNRKRLGQFLIGGIFTVCAAVAAALVDLVKKEERK